MCRSLPCTRDESLVPPRPSAARAELPEAPPPTLGFSAAAVAQACGCRSHDTGRAVQLSEASNELAPSSGSISSSMVTGGCREGRGAKTMAGPWGPWRCKRSSVEGDQLQDCCDDIV